LSGRSCFDAVQRVHRPRGGPGALRVPPLPRLPSRPVHHRFRGGPRTLRLWPPPWRGLSLSRCLLVWLASLRRRRQPLGPLVFAAAPPRFPTGLVAPALIGGAPGRTPGRLPIGRSGPLQTQARLPSTLPPASFAGQPPESRPPLPACAHRSRTSRENDGLSALRTSRLGQPGRTSSLHLGYNPRARMTAGPGPFVAQFREQSNLSSAFGRPTRDVRRWRWSAQVPTGTSQA